jgi:sulfonate transport system ATP-binding protein
MEGVVVASHAGRLTHAPPVVHLRGLVRGFGTRSVLRGIDLDIEQGDFVAMLGRSGSGKSTLLRAIAELDHGVAGRGELSTPENRAVVFQMRDSCRGPGFSTTSF